MITAVSAPEPSEDPKPKTEAEIIADYKVNRKENLENVANVVNAVVTKAVLEVKTAVTPEPTQLVTYERPLTDDELVELGMDRGISFADGIKNAMSKDPDIILYADGAGYALAAGVPKRTENSAPLDFDKAFANFQKDTALLSAIHYNRENLLALGFDPENDDDTVFGARNLYCGAHCRVHGSGWCTVRLAQKRPLKAVDRTEAIAEATALGLLSEDDK